MLQNERKMGLIQGLFHLLL